MPAALRLTFSQAKSCQESFWPWAWKVNCGAAKGPFNVPSPATRPRKPAGSSGQVPSRVKLPLPCRSTVWESIAPFRSAASVPNLTWAWAISSLGPFKDRRARRSFRGCCPHCPRASRSPAISNGEGGRAPGRRNFPENLPLRRLLAATGKPQSPGWNLSAWIFTSPERDASKGPATVAFRPPKLPRKLPCRRCSRPLPLKVNCSCSTRAV